jgi:hypothetical protein
LWILNDFFSTRVLAFSTFSSIFIITGWPGHSSSTPFLPSVNLLCHSGTQVLDKVFSLHMSCNKLDISAAVFFNFTGNFMLSCCSIFYQAWLWEF